MSKKLDFLKSASLIVGTSKAWIGINNLPREVQIINGNANNYGYDITVFGHDGMVVPNMPLYDILGTLIGTTDSSGNLKTYLPSSSYILDNSNKSFNGLYINNTTVSGNKGSLNHTNITALPYKGNLTLGSAIIYCDKDWILCHIDGNKYYLAAKEIYEITKFDRINENYAGSLIADRALIYQNNLINNYHTSVTKCLTNVTVEGVTAKVFVASYTQMNGGFGYFNSNDRRICKYNGSAQEYWTSSIGSTVGGVYMWTVTDNGALYDHGAHCTYDRGFRPFICLTL